MISVSPDLTILCLENIDVSEGFDTCSFPSLTKLSVRYIRLPDSGFDHSNFPLLRHFAYDGSVREPAIETLSSLAPQLDSIVLFFAKVDEFLLLVPSLDIDKILVIYPSDWKGLAHYADGFVHIRLEGPAVFGMDKHHYFVDAALRDLLTAFVDRTKCTTLETLYLLPLDWDQPNCPLALYMDTRPVEEDVLDEIFDDCAERNIEIILEDQLAEMKAETRLSDEFMKRLTRRRIELETSKEV